MTNPETIARRCFAALVVAHSAVSNSVVKAQLEKVIRECTRAGYLPRPGEKVEFREDL